MHINKYLIAAVLAFAIGAPIAGFIEGIKAPSTSLSAREPFSWLRPVQAQNRSKLESIKLANAWLNSPPLSQPDLRGKVVLIDFWTYTCINWLRTAPYVRAWAEKYKDQGLVVVGVHAPEFAFEKNIDNVRQAVKSLGIAYPVAIDNDHAVWNGFDNAYWPALYFIDAQGQVRHQHFGEGSYEESERFLQKLLADAGAANVDRTLVSVDPRGFEVAADWTTLKSPENYLGYSRTDSFASPGGAARDKPKDYQQPARLALNEWALAGDWTIRGDAASLNASTGALAIRFHARDVNLVMSPPASMAPVRFRLSIDGKPPGDAHGFDVDAQGYGTVSGQRLYQLLRQPDEIAERKLEVEFFGPGVELFALTFG